MGIIAGGAQNQLTVSKNSIFIQLWRRETSWLTV